MDVLGLKDIVLLALSIILTVGVGIVGYSIRTLHKDIKDKVKEAVEKAENIGKDLKGVEKEFMDFKAQLPRQFVLKDDYIRTISVFEKKLDEVKDNIILLVKRENGSES